MKRIELEEALKIYREAIRRWSLQSQITMLAEESLELAHASLKILRNPNLKKLAEEIADTEICISQIEDYFNLGSTIEYWKQKKLRRLKRRLSKCL